MDEGGDPLSFRKRLEKAGEMDLSSSGNVVRDETAVWIEPDDEARTIEMDDVKGLIKVQGYDISDPEPPSPDAEARALRKADPTADYKRNAKAYGVMCPTCLGSGKCQECGGRGRVKLIFKCKVCGGSGKCQECKKESEIDCPQCGGFVSQYADSCMKCGLSFTCAECGAHMPAMGTKCISCMTEFKCPKCRKAYPRAFSWRCPHCKSWNRYS